ncbi:hypothetical protein EPO34_02715 [Patescibacteria group bacterium]|nr:MAG: hypothetical protein EPO34_02715 [Patescibacteria group bacterium]
MHTLALTITKPYEHLRPRVNKLLAKRFHLTPAVPWSSYLGPQRFPPKMTVALLKRLFARIGLPAEGYDALLSPSNHLPIAFGMLSTARRRVDYGLVAHLLKEAANRIESGAPATGLMRQIRAASTELHARQARHPRSA